MASAAVMSEQEHDRMEMVPVFAAIGRILKNGDMAMHDNLVSDDAPNDEPLVLDASMRVEAEDGTLPESDGLLKEAAFDAAAQSLASLQTALEEKPSRSHTIAGKTPVRSDVPVTIEDMVRQEVRSLVSGWLDAHLPSMVEAMVRTEITRISGRR